MANNKKIGNLFIAFSVVAIIMGLFLVANPEKALAAQSDNQLIFGQTNPTGTLSPRPTPTAPQAPTSTQPSITPTVPSSTLQSLETSPIYSCAEAWGSSMSQMRSSSPWLSTAFSKGAEINTKVKYEYLAGRLLRFGIASAPECSNNGLSADGNATQCGVDAAYPKVVEWQNLFNDSIVQSSSTYMIPAVVLKGVFAQESQFWPGYYKNTWEAGLGHFTDNGADTALGWNSRLFSSVCGEGFDKDACKKTYFQFSSGEQAMLRGSLFSRIDATCSTCAGGISVDKGKQSIDVFSQALYGHCAQTGQIIRNVINAAPAKSVSFDDLWRITLADYNAGAGCIFNGVKKVKSAGLAITWANLSQRLDSNCLGAVRYVNAIETFGSSLDSPLPVYTPTTAPTATAVPSVTRTPAATATANPTGAYSPTPTSQSTTTQP